MNILFLDGNFPNIKKGGTSRAIINISKYLTFKNFGLFVAFYNGETDHNELFKGATKISSSTQYLIEFKRFLLNNNINAVINFTLDMSPSLIKVIKGINCNFISILNEDPLQFYKVTKNLILNKKYYYEPEYKLRRFLSFIYKHGAIKISNYKKKILLKSSDKFVVLSNQFKYILVNQYKLNRDISKKIFSIPNSLSYDINLNYVREINKEKRVLIVSRMDDLTKRITLALDIWNNAFKLLGYSEWQLDIVGGGRDSDKLIRYANNYKIKNVNFYGAQEPKLFYERSRIFMMTSCSEGFGMTLTEAQQFGCIPIAFNSYDALPDIINDNENGFIVDEGDKKGYEKKLVELMKNPEKLDKMMEPTIESTKRFDISIIGPMWLDLLQNNEK